MQIQCFKVRKIKKLWLDFLEIVVGEVEPLKVDWFPHNELKSLPQTVNSPDLVVVKLLNGIKEMYIYKYSSANNSHFLLALGFYLRVLHLPPYELVLVCLKGDVVVGKDLVHLLSVTCFYHRLLLLVLLLLKVLLCCVIIGIKQRFILYTLTLTILNTFFCSSSSSLSSMGLRLPERGSSLRSSNSYA